ncbi:MAG: STAS domain-containing protein [Candidatus Zhuqueibacterota bacterium]
MESFEVSKKNAGNVVVLYIKGYLDAHTAPMLEHELQSLIDEKQFNIIVNFKELIYISSAGLGVFMGFIEDIRTNSGDIKLTNMPSKIFRVFDLLGFPTLYDIFSEEIEAVNKFNS